MSGHGSLLWSKRSLIILGLPLLALWFKYDSEARSFQARETKKLEVALQKNEFAEVSAQWQSKEPWCPPTLESGVFGRLVIPRLRISSLIAEGAEPVQLARAVGHIATTAYPGQPGNCALAGHRDTFLRGLGEVRERDVIRIDTLQGTYTYVVEWSGVVEPHRVGVLDSTTESCLTLVTSYPFRATGAAPERFVVRAKQVDPTAWVAQ